jgi:hypothetical protein
MGGSARKEQQRNAGAFMGPDFLIGVPMRTLSDEYHDLPVDPEDDRVPDPEPPGTRRRLADALGRRLRHRS